jgi:hypothetical protein
MIQNNTPQKASQTIKDMLHAMNTTQRKVKLSLQQGVEAYRAVRC